MKIDLHAHTHHSDGELSPQQLVDLAVSLGLKAIAITDHDTVAGCQPAIDYAKTKNLEVVPGIEISCYEAEHGFVEVHVLGLLVNPHDPALLKLCQKIQDERIKQKKSMIAKLQQLGFEISFEEAHRLAHGSFGRPHLAKILVQKYPQRFSDVRAVFDQYLGNGKPAYVERTDLIRVTEAIKVIKAAGGVPILAHPGVYQLEGGLKLAEFFVSCGGAGLETSYPYDLICSVSKSESDKFNDFFKFYAEEHDLLQSAGSDFHGSTRKTVQLGQMPADDSLLVKIKERLGKHNH